jgi:hypothetical protein
MLRKMIQAFLVVSAIWFGNAWPAAGHGGHKHLMGTIETTDASSLSIKTPHGEIVTVNLTTGTKYFDGKIPASVKDATHGRRVVVDWEVKNGKKVAEEVSLGISAPMSEKIESSR